MRLNKDGEYELYDPSDGFMLKVDPESGVM